MKFALIFFCVAAPIMLSVVLAKWSASMPVAWGLGYFTAVALMNLDRHVFSKWLKK